MGTDDRAQDAQILVKQVFVAGIANACGQTVGHPFDLLKVRLQVQGRGGNKEVKYKGLVHGFRVMYTEEGGLIRGLFSAWRISALREFWYSGLRMGLYEPCKRDIFRATDRHDTPLYVKFGAGLISGVVAATLSNPLDLLKVRYQIVVGEEFLKLPGIARGLVGLYHEGGFKKLWQGYGANTARAAGITASQVASYDHVKHYLLRNQVCSEGQTLHLTASFIASLIAIIVTNPVDVLKTRMMNFNTYSSMRDCATQIFRHEGFSAFYKGSLMAWLRLGPHTVTTFVTYEWLRALFGIDPL
jgi:hypothetical protein